MHAKHAVPVDPAPRVSALPSPYAGKGASRLTATDPGTARAFPFLPAFTQPERVYVGPTGEIVRVRDDGGADPVLPGGHPRAGVAGDPCATRRAP